MVASEFEPPAVSVTGNSTGRVASPEGEGRRHPRMGGTRSRWVGVHGRPLEVWLPYLIYVLGGGATAATAVAPLGLDSDPGHIP